MQAYAATARLGSSTRPPSSDPPTTRAIPRESPRRPDGALIDELLGRLADLVVDRLVERSDTSTQPADDWMDAREAAAYLGVHRDTLRKLAAERTVPVHQDGPGCKLYFNRDELDEWRRASKAPLSRLRAVS